MLSGKKIALGVTGSIAAYKAAFLVRLLTKAGATVRVITTTAARDFVGNLTFSTLSGNDVVSDFSNESGSWNNHVELGLWADCLVVAPATANTIAKMANGLCDNLLLATYLSAKCTVVVAPAMDLDMWKHPTTQNNIEKLKSFGNEVISVESGELASGLVGEGRMAEPENIVEFLENLFNEKKNVDSHQVLIGKTALVTAGPTREFLDPVRFLTNPSSGKMGVAIAQTLADLGVDVQLICTNQVSVPNHPNIHCTEISTAREMHEACTRHFPKCDIAIMAAAVADLTPVEVSGTKMKKDAFDVSQEDDLTVLIPFKKTKDILAKLGKLKTEKQILVGFALETDNAEANGLKKLRSKNCDLLVLNSLADNGAGFQHDTNKVSIINRAEKISTFDLKPKTDVAHDIVNEIIKELNAR